MSNICLIIVCPPGKTPELDDLIDATIENPDGSGWCMRVNGTMEVVKSADKVDHVIGSFMQARERWPNAWAVWHSRMATQGQNTDDNTHPFKVPGKPWHLVHNGIMPLSDGPRHSRGVCRSDSRIFADDHVSEMKWTEMYATDRKGLEDWLGWNKVVILSERREVGGPCLILNEDLGNWDEEDGCWYSHYVDKSTCKGCHKRTVRCVCPKPDYSYKSSSVHGWKPSTLTTWDKDGYEWVEDDEHADEEWWATQTPDRFQVGDTVHVEGDIDCDCLDCEELRYWEAKEREDDEGTAPMLERFAAVAEFIEDT